MPSFNVFSNMVIMKTLMLEPRKKKRTREGGGHMVK